MTTLAQILSRPNVPAENNSSAAPAAPGIPTDLQGRAGADAGAGNSAAPAHPALSDQRKYDYAGTPGAAGAQITHPSEPSVDEWPDALPDDWGEWPA